MAEDPKNRPYTRQEGFITVFKEVGLYDRWKLERVPMNNSTETGFQWRNPDTDETRLVLESEIVWRDIFVSSLDWGKKPKAIKKTPAGQTGERSTIIGFEPSFSFKCAYINKNLFKLMRFMTKYRFLLELKEDEDSPIWEEFQFLGCSVDDWKASGSADLVDENVTIHVEELPLDEQQED